ncbi:MAG: HD domain-containing protein [Actinomycetota bacterium]|nr:HD domain-containing protein [Actinomycetota bacterium]
MEAEKAGEPERWRGRPTVARALRVLVVVAPLLCGVGASLLISRLLPDAHATGGRLLWWLAIFAVSTVVMYLVDHVLRRLLPLAALLEMSVLFPGRAPSRFAVARDAGDTRHLAQALARAHDARNSTPAEAAQTILALVGSLSGHDRKTRGHAERVRVFTDLIADELRLPQPARDRLRWAALLHDIGKLTVPPPVLNKAGKPDKHEWELLKRHPDEGARLAWPLLPWLGEWGALIAQHHERYDGLGYPRGISGESICLGARIVAVADSFEVMTAARSYKRPMSRAAALRELVDCSGRQFDPAVVRALLNVSTPRLRLAMGPLSWLVQVPLVRAASTVSLNGATQAAGTAAGVGALVVSGAIGAATPAASSPASGAGGSSHVAPADQQAVLSATPSPALSLTDVTSAAADRVIRPDDQGAATAHDRGPGVKPHAPHSPAAPGGPVSTAGSRATNGGAEPQASGGPTPTSSPNALPSGRVPKPGATTPTISVPKTNTPTGKIAPTPTST